MVLPDIMRPSAEIVIPYLHHTTSCQNGLTTGWMFVYTI